MTRPGDLVCGGGCRVRPVDRRLFPGTSRSGATILLMLMLGLSRPAATEFSFLVGIPTMLAAGRTQDLPGALPLARWGCSRAMGLGAGRIRRVGRSLVPGREVAAALYPNPHLRDLRLVPHRARGSDFLDAFHATMSVPHGPKFKHQE